MCAKAFTLIVRIRIFHGCLFFQGVQEGLRRLQDFGICRIKKGLVVVRPADHVRKGITPMHWQ